METTISCYDTVFFFLHHIFLTYSLRCGFTYTWVTCCSTLSGNPSSSFFPTCQVRVVRFYVRCAAPPSPLYSPSLRRICQLLIAVIFAGPHLPVLFGSGRRPTSSASAWSQWASPDFNRRESERCGSRRTSTGESLSAVGLAGRQPARFGASWASPDGRIECHGGDHSKQSN